MWLVPSAGRPAFTGSEEANRCRQAFMGTQRRSLKVQVHVLAPIDQQLESAVATDGWDRGAPHACDDADVRLQMAVGEGDPCAPGQVITR